MEMMKKTCIVSDLGIESRANQGFLAHLCINDAVLGLACHRPKMGLTCRQAYWSSAYGGSVVALHTIVKWSPLNSFLINSQISEYFEKNV